MENSVSEGLRTSLKEEITSEMRRLLADSQKKLLKLLKSTSNESVREQEENSLENEPRELGCKSNESVREQEENSLVNEPRE